MSGVSNYPTALDDDTSLYDVVENVTAVTAPHHNNIKEAVKALEVRVGIVSSDSPVSLDYRIGSPTDSHNHNGASGQGQTIDFASVVRRQIGQMSDNYNWVGVASQFLAPYFAPRTMWIEAINLSAIRGPSGGTSVIDVNIGATSIWYASQGFRLMMGPTAGRMIATSGAPNVVTVPSGSLISADIDTAAASMVFDRPTITILFRE